MSPSPVGALFQYWRKARRLSQLALAVTAEVSPRHICFLETGRARPSREMVLLLASALDVPLRERNALLLAAGFAPVYEETSLDAPELAPARAAIEAILRQQEPYPAVVMNRRWDILVSNTAAARFFGLLLPGGAPEPPNVLRLMFSPEGLRPAVVNWEEAAEALVRRAQREVVGHVLDDGTRALLDEILAYPGVPARWRSPGVDRPQLPVVPVSFRLGTATLSFFSAITTLGTAQDITLQELRVESFFPLDEATATAMKTL